MLPIVLDAVGVYRGDDVIIADCTFQQPAGVAMNLSTSAWSAQWRLKSDSENFVALQVDATQANLGRILIQANSAATSLMTARGVWDLQATLNGVVKTWVRGSTVLVKDVTRP